MTTTLDADRALAMATAVLVATQYDMRIQTHSRLGQAIASRADTFMAGLGMPHKELHSVLSEMDDMTIGQLRLDQCLFYYALPMVIHDGAEAGVLKKAREHAKWTCDRDAHPADKHFACELRFLQNDVSAVFEAMCDARSRMVTPKSPGPAMTVHCLARSIVEQLDRCRVAYCKCERDTVCFDLARVSDLCTAIMRGMHYSLAYSIMLRLNPACNVWDVGDDLAMLYPVRKRTVDTPCAPSKRQCR